MRNNYLRSIYLFYLYVSEVLTLLNLIGMKKIILSIFISAFILIANAQDSLSTKKKYNNEFGIDATAFFKQFIFINNSDFGTVYYEPTYYLTYRRHFKPGNIRFGIGIGFSNSEQTSSNVDDDNNYEYNAIGFDARIGWEFVEKLSKRWEVYYGLDFRPSYRHVQNDVIYLNAGYANGYEETYKLYSFSPLLGFRFRLTERLSLTTEASFSVIITEIERRNYFTPVTDQYPAIPDKEYPKVKMLNSSFSQPLFIIITFDI